MQPVYFFDHGSWLDLGLPEPETLLTNLPEIRWGNVATLFSPAQWRYFHWTDIEIAGLSTSKCRIGETLLEETIACLLGGHGLQAETSMAYFHKLKKAGVFEKNAISQEAIINLLKTPVELKGAMVRYRFWRTKGKQIHAILVEHRAELEMLERSCSDPRVIRSHLTKFKGLGLKTASWIARNWFNCEHIAVIDVHILRALALIGLPYYNTSRPKEYLEAELNFVALANSLQVPSQTLDLVMWSHMRELNHFAQRQLAH